MVRRGAVFPESAIAFIGSEDLFGSSEMVARPGPTKSQMAAFAADLADLKPGDFVVHATHGVGKFLGIREIVQGDQKGDFMLLEYSSDAKLYVLCSRAWTWWRSTGRWTPPAAARPAGRRILDRAQIAGQGQDAGHGG